MPSLATINYILSPRGYFWAWSDDCAVEWEDGSTIAVWEEIDAILTALAPRGLPPLGSVVLILAACGDAWPRRWPQVRHLAAASTGESEPLRTTERLLRPVQHGLDAIQALPADLRRGVHARCQLIGAIFEGVFNRLPQQVAEEIVSDVKREGLEFRRREKPDLGIHMRLLRDLSALDATFSKLDLTHLEERLRSGVDIVTVQEVALPPFDPAGLADLPLLDQLEKQPDKELSSIAAISRRVVAMLTVPRLAGQLRELPVGGISDITNRGDYTRLLPGELAWDEEMFSARLAHAEALFYRREVPPEAPRATRTILLDHGIRLWGLPRLYALAVALGVASHGIARSAEIEIWRRECGEFLRLPLATVPDVQSHLAALSPSVTPTDALNAWASAAPKSQQEDIFFISHCETIQSPEVINALQAMHARAGSKARLFTLGLDREGELEFAQHSVAGARMLAECRIDLDALLPAQPKQRAKPSPTSLSRRLYARDQKIAQLSFYKQWPLPMKFRAAPMHGQLRNTAWENCVVAVDTERRLMAWSDLNMPATELAYGLPKARNYWTNPNPDSNLTVVCSAHSPGERVKLCRQQRGPEVPEVIELRSKHSFPRRVTFCSGAAILHYQGGAEAFSLATGSQVAEIEFAPDLQSPSLEFDGEILRLGGESREERILIAAETGKTPAIKVEKPIPPAAVGLINGKLSLAWEREVRVWSAMGKCFQTFKREGPLKASKAFELISGPSPSQPEAPEYWHARSSAADFYYDVRGVFHIVTDEAQVALPIDPNVASDVWTDPPKCGRKTIAEVEQRMQILAALP